MLRAKNQSKITRFSNAGLIMFRRVHEVRSILEFLRERAPHYGPLARDDLHKFRDEIVKASVGASISAAAGLIFACFLSVAVIVSAWDGLHRTAVAWTVCGARRSMVCAKSHFGSAAISAHGGRTRARLSQPSRGGGSTRVVGATIDQGLTPEMSIAPMESASAAAAVCALARASSTCVSPWTTAFSSVARSV
jgi:hypothetical protein